MSGQKSDKGQATSDKLKHLTSYFVLTALPCHLSPVPCTPTCPLAVLYSYMLLYIMSFIELVRSRYSCRKFSDKPVEKAKLDLCLEAARLAPSACNSQPWKFLIIDDPALKDKVCEAAFSGQYSSNSFGKNAPVIVVVISEKGTFMARVGNLVRDTRFYLIDIGVAVEHFILQAAEQGLGTCWMGWFNETALKKALNLPKSVKVDIIFPVGYPAQPNREKIRKTMKEISGYNS